MSYKLTSLKGQKFKSYLFFFRINFINKQMEANMKRKTICILLFLIIILNSCNLYAYSIPIWVNDGTTEVAADSADNFLNIESESAILIEQSTGQILFEKNSHEKLRPASVTKVMTILLIMEALDRGDITLETRYSLQ